LVITPRNTGKPLIMRVQENMLTWNDLAQAIEECDQKQLQQLLIKLVPRFKPQCEISDILYKSVILPFLTPVKNRISVV